MTPLIIALISFSIALVAGVLLSKAYFTAQKLQNSISADTHGQALHQQRRHYRKQLEILHNKAKKKISAQHRKIQELKAEIEHLHTEPHNPNSTKEFYDAKFVESLRVEITVLRENLNTRDERIGELEAEIRDSHIKAQDLLNELNDWKLKVSPLSQKIHEQRELIEGLQGTRGPEETPISAFALQPEEIPPSEETQQPDEMTMSEEGISITDDAPDDLKKIRGIGPALERRLNNTGIDRYQQIADLSEPELMDLAAKISVSPAVAERDQWIQQARSLQYTVES